MKKICLTLSALCLCALACTPALANTTPQDLCPSKRLGEGIVEGTFVKETSHESYYGFLVQDNNGISYDIGIGNDIYPQEFEGLKPGNSIKLPFYTEQYYDSTLGHCVVKNHRNTESSVKGSYAK